MIVWRVTKRRHSTKLQVLGGEGAKEGGRWNKPGLAVVYASENSSLAILENLVHFSERRLPKSLVAVRIIIPDGVSVRTIRQANLPSTWRTIDNLECIAMGSDWIESRRELVLRVPSAANSLEENVLLNPLHADISKCQVGDPVPVVFDPRMIALIT